MKKLCSLVLAGAVLLGALCVPCSAAGQAAAAETAAASGADSRVSAGLAGGYRRYRQSHADAVRPSATADVPIGTAKKADGQSAVFVTDGDTVRPAVQIADGESIVLTVDVPETGLYQVQVLYRPLPGKDIDLSCALYIDGALPFSSAAGLTLTRTWKDSDERSFSDDQGNEYRPVQVEQSQWMSAWLCAKDEYLDGGYEFYLTAGTHALTLESVQEGFLLGGMTLGREETAPTYAEYLAAHKAEGRTPESISAEPVFLEGEDAARRSHPILYSIADYSSCITQPYDVYRSLQNTIGGENWSAKGQWLQWDFTVGTAGFYQLAFRFKQNYKSGSFSVRRLTVDGAVPFAEAGQIGFSYGLGWNVTALGGDEPQYIYLTPGKHTLMDRDIFRRAPRTVYMGAARQKDRMVGHPCGVHLRLRFRDPLFADRDARPRVHVAAGSVRQLRALAAQAFHLHEYRDRRQGHALRPRVLEQLLDQHAVYPAAAVLLYRGGLRLRAL